MARRESTFARSVTGTRAHARCALRPASAAAARSSGVLCGTSPSTVPVAGISMGIGSARPLAATRAASRSRNSRVIRGPSGLAPLRMGILAIGGIIAAAPMPSLGTPSTIRSIQRAAPLGGGCIEGGGDR